jgi:DNA-binding transcriptional ArsR family regulator
LTTQCNGTPDRGAASVPGLTLQELLYGWRMPTSRGRPKGKRVARPTAHRVGGLQAMRALAHPTRVRMMHLLRAEPLSASELARRLDIRFGSAQYHLRSLQQAGIALKVGERSRRGGTEVLFEVPQDIRVDEGPDTPLGIRHAMDRAYVDEVVRRMDASSADRLDTELDMRATRELELDAGGVEAATEALHAFLHRLDELALPRPSEGSMTFTAATLFFRVPGSTSRGREGSEP